MGVRCCLRLFLELDPLVTPSPLKGVEVEKNHLQLTI